MDLPRSLSYKVRSYNSGVPGRVLCQVRNHHFVVDEPKFIGGPGEEVSASEIFLSGISACAVGAIEAVARENRISLTAIDVTIEALRDLQAPPIHKDKNVSVYQSVRMSIALTGPSEQQAQGLVDTYKRL